MQKRTENDAAEVFRMRRYVSLLIAVLFITAGLCSCGKRESQKQPVPDDGEKQSVSDGNTQSDSITDFVCDLFIGDGFLTEKYALYHCQNGGALHLFDTTEKTDVVFCFDPGCEHKPAVTSLKGDIIKEGCPSYAFGESTVMLQGDKCYFLTDNGDLILADRQGENRKKIGSLPPYVLLPSLAVFSDDALYVVYHNSYEMIEKQNDDGSTQWIIGDVMDQTVTGIFRMNLSDGSCSEIFHAKDYNSRIPTVDIRGEHLYFEYFCLDIPFVGPDLETYGPSGQIPEGLTVENYWDEMPKHQWIDVYDYHMTTGELNSVLSHRPCKEMVFCNGFFALSEGETTALYRYNGEKFRTLDFPISSGYRSDSGLICINAKEAAVYLLIDENTGEVIKRVNVPYGTFNPRVFIGTACYGLVNGSGIGYLSAEDFWNGQYQNATVFPEE